MHELTIRVWRKPDDRELAPILRAQMAQDPTWPPKYARDLNPAIWLGTPADLGRWVCESDARVIGHIGLGSLTVAKAKPFCASINCQPRQFAELCRTVVEPSQRSLGAASKLTRTAIKAALGMQRIPIATVLSGRTTWLEMMLNTGWRQVGDAPSRNTSERLVSLLPPQKFVDAIVNNA